MFGFIVFISIVVLVLIMSGLLVHEFIKVRGKEAQLAIEQEKTKQYEAALKLVNDFDESKVRKSLAERKPREWSEQETTYAVTELLKKSFGTPPAYIIEPDEYWPDL